MGWDALAILDHWGIEVNTGPYSDGSESDEVETLRRELEYQRIAAHLERRCRTERAVIFGIDPAEDGSLMCCVVTPTGDSAKEHELARVVVLEAMAMRFVGAQVFKAIPMLTERLESGEIDEAEAWRRLCHVLAVVAFPGPEEAGETGGEG